MSNLLIQGTLYSGPYLIPPWWPGACWDVKPTYTGYTIFRSLSYTSLVARGMLGCQTYLYRVHYIQVPILYLPGGQGHAGMSNLLIQGTLYSGPYLIPPWWPGACWDV